jgi:acyl-coenzyme A thioesterase PaaI-like protein
MTFDPTALGWRPMRDNDMPAAIGTPWAKRTGDTWIYARLTTTALANPEGAVHGGMLMTFADHCLGLYVWEASNRAPNVTIQFNMHFLAAVMPGDFVELHGEVTRATRGLVFVRGILKVGERDVAAVDGVWRILRAAQER